MQTSFSLLNTVESTEFICRILSLLIFIFKNSVDSSEFNQEKSNKFIRIAHTARETRKIDHSTK